jgi:hypothetical protein
MLGSSPLQVSALGLVLVLVLPVLLAGCLFLLLP